MTAFQGHLIPGTFFVILSVWWTINTWKYYFRSKCQNGAQFRSLPWYPGPFCAKFPLESMVKVFGASFMFFGQLSDAFRDGKFLVFGNAEHMTIYFFFGLNGAMDLLKHYDILVPAGIEAASGILAYGVEGFLILNHLHRRPLITVQMHLYLFCTIMACVLSVFLEIQYRDCVIPTMSRAFFTLMQGTWLGQMAFVLYPPWTSMPKWDLTDHGQMMIVTLMLTWHVAANFVAMLLIGTGVWMCMKGSHQLGQVGSTCKMNGSNGHADAQRLLKDYDCDKV